MVDIFFKLCHFVLYYIRWEEEEQRTHRIHRLMSFLIFSLYQITIYQIIWLHLFGMPLARAWRGVDGVNYVEVETSLSMYLDEYSFWGFGVSGFGLSLKFEVF